MSPADRPAGAAGRPAGPAAVADPAGCVPAPRIRGAGVLTGWGEGLPLPRSAAPAGAGTLVAVPTPEPAGERLRRATRECRLAVAAVERALADAGLPAAALGGPRTGILYATATAYAGANRAFLEESGTATLHFPYTAPSAVPGEVTIEFGLRGPAVALMGGGPAALAALWTAAGWLAAGEADRVLVLAVEAVQEVRDLVARAARLVRGPILEGAACLLLEPGPGAALRWASAAAAGPRGGPAVAAVLDAVLDGAVPGRVASGASGRPGRAERAVLAARGVGAAEPWPGEPLGLGPLLALAEARAAAAGGPWLLTASWRDDYGAMLWP